MKNGSFFRNIPLYFSVSRIIHAYVICKLTHAHRSLFLKRLDSAQESMFKKFKYGHDSANVGFIDCNTLIKLIFFNY